MRLLKSALTTGVIMGVSIVAMANVVGASSNVQKVQVGAIQDDKHGLKNEGVGIQVVNKQSTSTVVNKFVDLGGLKAKSEKTFTRVATNIGGQDAAGVVQLDFNKWNLPKFIPDHKPLGKFSYQELPNNVYFGEWHQGSSTNANDADRTVFYVGKDAQSTPTSGKATYQVVGINQYNGSVNGLWQGWTGKATTAQPNNLLTGTFTADFSAKTLNGTLNRGVNGGANVTNTLNINAGIDNSGAFDGTAIANNHVSGETKGQFFGANAASLAGVATFDGNHKFDTAFGGSKK
ncbi:Slam-dependent surface lipoprotein [Moraxella sp. ZJ142]|uniref:Slam-dependent surface lipoprotein n=1 Tax=Moraxella marmotae TaxID=3344520 RepID=UPI0035D43D47